MRWLLLWLLLTAVLAAGSALCQGVLAGEWRIPAETLAHVVLVPPAQVLALWVVAAVRRRVRPGR